jgi:hypothetical protein
MKWIELGQWFVRTSLDVLKITDDDRNKVGPHGKMKKVIFSETRNLI